MRRIGAPIGLAVLAKFFGLILIVIGVFVFHYTRLSEGIEGLGLSLFIFFGLVLIVLGIFSLITQAK
jgi:hypothetical protein